MKEWRTGNEDARKLRNIHKRPHIATGTKLYHNIKNRKHLAWIARLRMGHCSLNKYLHRFHKIDDSTCECEEREEMVEHYLLRCEKFDRQRDRLRRKVGIEGTRIEKLLGDPKLIQHTIKYIEEAERFTSQ